MAVLHPAHPHVTIHNWDAPYRPRLASVVDLMRRCLVQEAATTKAASFRIAHGLPERHRNHALTAEYDTCVDVAQHADKCLSNPDFVDDLLAVVAKVHSSNWSAGASYPTWPASPSIVLQLVTTCMSKSLDNAVFHDAAWIALRKLPSPLAPLRHLGEKYTRVPLLVTLPVSPQVAVEQTLSQPHSDDSSPSEASEVIESLSDLSEFLAAGMKIKLPEPRCEWLDLPVAPRSPLLQRNVFAAESPQHSLCILVVADPDTICDAMSSALYHRLAWGVRGPLAGISYLPDSPVVALHLGWLDDSSCSSDDDLPQVHILGPKASPTVHDDDYPQNLYSMVDPGDVLSLARILLSLRHSFADDLSGARLLDVELLPQWRADQEIACPTRGSRWTPETVEEWSRRIEPGTNPDLSSPIRDNDANLNSDISHPFDRFVAMKDRNGYLPTATSLWLLDRLVIYHSLPPIDVYHDPTTYGLLLEEIRVYVPAFALYRRATQFTWPQWQSLDSLPPLPRALEELACDLFSAYESCHDGAPHRVAAIELSGEAARILERELATVLRVADLARSLNATSKAQTYQVLYDMLFSILVPCTATQIHPAVAIRLSRSTFYDIVASRSGDEAVREVRRMHREHFWIQTAVAELFCEADEVRYPLLDGAVQRASTDQNYRYTDLDSVCRRVLEAPTMGACDFALAARFTPTFDKARHPRSLPSIISGHCMTATSRTFPTPYHPSPESFGAPMTMWRTVTFDILASAHQAYPSADTTRLGETRPTSRISARGARSSPDTTGHDAALRPDNDSEGMMDVPVLLVVHSVRRMHFNIADSNRLRMCLTSAVQFLASIQILDFPLFGLLTEGTRCAVVMAWATHCEGQTFAQVHMMDQNCTSYDLSDPAGAFNFATFLLWVQYEHVPRLLGCLHEAHRAGLSSKLVSEDDCSAWSAEAQLKHIKQTVSADPDYHPSAYFPYI